MSQFATILNILECILFLKRDSFCNYKNVVHTTFKVGQLGQEAGNLHLKTLQIDKKNMICT